MTDAFAAALFTALPATIASIATLVVGIRNTRQIADVAHQTNAMKDELVRSTAVASETIGKERGAAEERTRQVEDRAEQRSTREVAGTTRVVTNATTDILDSFAEHAKLDDVRFGSLEKLFGSLEKRFDMVDRQLQRIAGPGGPGSAP